MLKFVNFLDGNNGIFNSRLSQDTLLNNKVKSSVWGQSKSQSLNFVYLANDEGLKIMNGTINHDISHNFAIPPKMIDNILLDKSHILFKQA